MTGRGIEREVLAATLDEAERCSIPERRRTAVAEDDLVTFRRAQQIGQTLAGARDEVLDGGLAVRRSEERCPARDESFELSATDLGGSAAESAVDGKQFAGQLDHVPILGLRRGRPGPGAGEKARLVLPPRGCRHEDPA